ncbi:MAG: PepSY domain-containing protein [Acidobacteriota bacterium]|nr:PepSY domain-containing protein [Acidobacteriota bacterium]
MGLRKSAYVFHRWVSLAVCLQLVAWSAGGLFFSLFPLETIRGTADASRHQPAPLDLREGIVSPRQALDALGRAARASAPVTALCLHGDGDGSTVYRLLDADQRVLGVVDAVSGGLRPPLAAGEAARIAQRDFSPSAAVTSVEWIATDPPLEVRGRALPVWKVALDHPRRPHLYIDAVSGEVVARRNRLWRIFDFFWMLHIMDYSRRENFHHPLLTAASALALLSSLSGIALWSWRLGSFRRRRRRA